MAFLREGRAEVTEGVVAEVRLAGVTNHQQLLFVVAGKNFDVDQNPLSRGFKLARQGGTFHDGAQVRVTHLGPGQILRFEIAR